VVDGVVNQFPGVRQQCAESPLLAVQTVSHPDPGVSLAERRFRGHLVLRGDPAGTNLAEVLAQTSGLVLPTTPMQLSGDGEPNLQWISPDEWLLILPPGAVDGVADVLRGELRGHTAVVDVSAGQTIIELQGARAREVLMKSTPYDVHPSVFPVGKGVVSVFAKTSVNIRCRGESHWELVVRRSYADYVWRWLLDAGAEYGVVALPPT
jgi:sarcosine oxidase, subunit gamma